MHDTAHFRRRNEDAVFQTLDAQKAVAGAICTDRAFDRAAWLRRNTVPGFVFIARGAARRTATRWRARRSFRSTGPTRPTRSSAGSISSTAGSTRSAYALPPRPRPVSLRFSAVGRSLFLVRPGLAVLPPELRSTRAQLTAPDPVRTLRGLPHLPGWRNW
jgi:hypothetical protein